MSKPGTKDGRAGCLPSFFLICFVAILAFFFGPVRSILRGAKETAAMETGQEIYMYLSQYSTEHDNPFPSGSSSTEIFQKLIDGKYATNPATFYLPMPGKTKPTSLHLKPENVSWDITVPVDQSSREEIPIVFTTGYRIEYKPGGRALPLPNKSRPPFEGLVVVYHINAARFFRAGAYPESSIPNCIPANATLGATDYIQLTPEGPLPKQ